MNDNVSNQGYVSIEWCSVPLQGLSSWSPPKLQANTWVRLIASLNPFCHDEALLLCEHDEEKWVAWVPDHGEAILDRDQFCLMV